MSADEMEQIHFPVSGDVVFSSSRRDFAAVFIPDNGEVVLNFVHLGVTEKWSMETVKAQVLSGALRLYRRVKEGRRLLEIESCDNCPHWRGLSGTHGRRENYGGVCMLTEERDAHFYIPNTPFMWRCPLPVAGAVEGWK